MGYLSWGRYAVGYKLAGDILVEHCVTHGDQNTLVFPVIFLYRQYIELRIKEIIQDGNQVLGKAPGLLRYQQHHKIGELWGDCKGLLEEIDKDELARLSKDGRNKRETDLDAVQEDINKFSEWDPNSYAFRYPVDKNGKPSISASELRNINFKSLQELVERISYWLDGISVGVWECLKAKQEMNSQM